MKKWKNLIWIVAILVANNLNAQLTLERTHVISDFPSGSAIEFATNKLFVTGDDATHFLVLNSNYSKVDSVRLYDGDKRISKSKKTDLESSTSITIKNSQHLLFLGSSSTKKRDVVIVYPLQKDKTFESYRIKKFNKRVINAGMKDLNYEGLASTSNNIIIANRGHLNNPINKLIISDLNFWQNQKKASIHIIDINLENKLKSFAGISGLTYVSEKDILFFTASTENTTNSYEDGEISDSYLGWINSFSKKIKTKEITPDGFINMSENNQSFKQQKIESVAVQEVLGNDLILHFVADNDNGQTTLFRARFKL